MAYSNTERKSMTDAELVALIRAKGNDLAALLEEAHQAGLIVEPQLTRTSFPSRGNNQWAFNVRVWRKTEL